MPKIKLNKFEGIYTNIDENDSRFDLFRESANFRHENGYIQFEPRNLSAIDMPPVDADAGDPEGTWEWETGIYSVITNDPLSFTKNPQQWNVLLLVAKKYSGGIYYRRIYYKVIDVTPWVDALTNPAPHMDYDILSTSRSGDVKITADQGAIKIYMPHDCFWFGYLHRRRLTRHEYDITADSEGNWSFNDNLNQIVAGDYYGFYLDRLVEPNSDSGFQGTAVDTGGADPATYIEIGDSSMRLRVFTSVENIAGDSLPDEEKYTYSLCKRVFAGHGSRGVYDFHIFYMLVLDQSANWDGKSKLTSDTGYEFWEAATGSGTITPNGGDYPSGENKLYNNWVHQLPPGFRIPGTTTYTNRAYYDSENLIDNQIVYEYDKAEKRLFAGPSDWVVTATLDETTEIVVAHGKAGSDPANPLSPTDSEKYLLNFKFKIPTNINQRISRISAYIREYTYDDTDTKWKPNDTYERAYTQMLITTDVDTWEMASMEAKLSGSDFDGVTLASQIGVAYEPGEYNIISGFRDYTKEVGIGIGIDYNDYVNVYHSVVGGGVMQSDLVYKSNQLQLPGVSFVNALVPVNGNIVALTDVSAHVIKGQEISGVLAFSILHSMNYGVKNFRDVAIIPGGFIMHTKTGIFFSNGYGQPDLISKSINDIVKANYSTGTIKYNARENELYYRPTSSDDLYRFRFDRGVWELRNVTVTNNLESEVSTT